MPRLTVEFEEAFLNLTDAEAGQVALAVAHTIHHFQGVQYPNAEATRDLLLFHLSAEQFGVHRGGQHCAVLGARGARLALIPCPDDPAI